MSYSILSGTDHQVPLYPLSLAQTPPPPAPPWWKNRALAVIALLLVIALILYWIEREERRRLERNRRQHRTKRSTAQMAKDLYARLDERGGVQESTMRSLRRLASKA